MNDKFKILIGYDGSDCADIADVFIPPPISLEDTFPKVVPEAVKRAHVRSQEKLNDADTWGADCIFVGAKGTRGIDRLLLGSVSSAVAARARCSVEVVRKTK